MWIQGFCEGEERILPVNWVGGEGAPEAPGEGLHAIELHDPIANGPAGHLRVELKPGLSLNSKMAEMLQITKGLLASCKAGTLTLTPTPTLT